jgi:hypothetical protein
MLGGVSVILSLPPTTFYIWKGKVKEKTEKQKNVLLEINACISTTVGKGKIVHIHILACNSRAVFAPVMLLLARSP